MSTPPQPPATDLDPRARAELETLLAVTQIPTAAGREHRVVAWVRRWAAARPDLSIREDAHGNLVLRLDSLDAGPASAPLLYITAHLDHPAFVVEAIENDSTVELSFRGGVMAEYFDDARVTIHPGTPDEPATPVGAMLRGRISPAGGQANAPVGGDDPSGAASRRHTFDLYRAVLDQPVARGLRVGDVAVWELPPAQVAPTDNGTGRVVDCVHTLGCDDLAAVAAALCTLDRLRTLPLDHHARGGTRVLLTRAEEIGFVGCIGACRSGTVEPDARVIALENSRSFPHDSPIGGGPIVRVGDRVSTFSPGLTAAVCDVAESLAGGPSIPHATGKINPAQWPWQRKLMAGGACEASVFCASGYEATCVCLPLGNYHNMSKLAEVQAGLWLPAPGEHPRPRVAREYIGLADYLGMIDLLAACAHQLTAPEDGADHRRGGTFSQRLDKLWAERAWVLA